MSSRIGITIALAISASLAAPTLAQDARMSDLLRKKYEIEQQRADAERARAESAANARRQQQANRSRATPTPHDLSEGDPLEGTNVPKCKIGGGATIRVSGSFRPSSAVKCVEPTEANENEVVSPSD